LRKEQTQDLASILEVVSLERRLDAPAEEDGVGALVLQVMLRQYSHQEVELFVLWFARSIPYAHEVLVANIETH
jgi:hypothetical protein